VDLARLVGVSTQAVRSYTDAGILPPAERTAAGYRVYLPKHRDALLAYRALLPGAGPQAAREILPAVNAGDRRRALELLDAVHAELHETRRELREITDALDVVDRPSRLPGTDLRIGEVARVLGVRTSTLRVWEAEGLLTPRWEKGTQYRVYSPAGVRASRTINLLRRARYPRPRIGAVLDAAREAGGTDALRDAVRTRAEEVHRRATALLDGSALLHACLSATAESTEDR
jgi:DNA-binding transcriptional MerR regulator